MSIAELKLKQRLLREQVDVLDSKALKCSQLLHRRRAAKLESSPNNPEQSRSLQQREKRRQRSMLRDAASNSMQPMPPQPPPPSLMKASVASSGMADLRRKDLMNHLKNAARLEEKNAQRPLRGPGKAGAFKKNPLPETLFPVRHTRNELPCSVEHVSFGMQLSWVCPLNVLDYEHYLPIFVDGLVCPDHPFDFMARQGCHELLEEAVGSPARILPCLPATMPLLRKALLTKHPDLVLAGLNFLRELAHTDPKVGEALVPYYRMLLGVLNLYVTKRNNLGDAHDYSQGKDSFENLGDKVVETLEMLERTGGPKAFANIKYMVPTYQSCM